jgi:hypothetical protein
LLSPFRLPLRPGRVSTRSRRRPPAAGLRAPPVASPRSLLPGGVQRCRPALTQP